jgi:prepilin-type N-terminal cleavage/methylation domain-containing protein
MTSITMRPRSQANSASNVGFTLVEMAAAMTIIAVVAALVLPVLSGLSSASSAKAAAGKIANLVNHRIALARSGAGPSTITIAGDSKVVAVIPEELSVAAAASGANNVLGRNLLKGTMSKTSAVVAVDEESAVESADLGEVTIDALYVKAASTGEPKDALSILSGGACDDALFVLSSGGLKSFVSVRGLTGRACAYDTLPSYLANYFEVPQDAVARGK